MSYRASEMTNITIEEGLSSPAILFDSKSKKSRPKSRRVLPSDPMRRLKPPACAMVAMLAMVAVTIMLVGDGTSTSTVLEAKAAQ